MTTSKNVSPDELTQEVCAEILALIQQAIETENPRTVSVVRIPNGPEVGRQITINAAEENGPANQARLSLLNADLAPAGEAARVEYEHDKPGKFGMRRVYSVQSIRRVRGKLELLENFMAQDAQSVREEDFRAIESGAYGRETVLKSLASWVDYRAAQLRAG